LKSGGPPSWLARRLRLRSRTVRSALANEWRHAVLPRLAYPVANWKATRGQPVPYRGSLRILLMPKDRVVSPAIVAHGGFARHEVTALCRLLRPGDVAVDVGANIGCHSLAFAEVVGPAGRVLAFEPEPRNVRLLRANAELNGLAIEVHPVALSDAAGRLTLHLVPGNAGAHAIGPPARAGDGTGTVEVEATTLDDALAALGGRKVRLLKMDVEGYEWRVVAGARRVLRQHRPIVMTEFSPLLIARRGGDAAAYLDAFKELGYAPLVLHEDGAAAPTTWEALRRPPRSGLNLLLLPGEAARDGGRLP
jgi:FkbM family methyltransferase